MAGIGPEDVDIAQVHDAATIGELQQIEALHLAPFGEAWQATVAGRTALNGDIPVNTDGGLLAMGHPSALRVSAWCTKPLPSCAASRAAASGKPAGRRGAVLRGGDVTTVHILTR